MKRIALFTFVVAVTSICSGQWLEREVVIGDTFGGIGYPGKLVVNPISGNVYIYSNPIQIFNPSTMEKMRGPGVTGSVVFCPPSGKGYVVRETLAIIDATADTVIGSTVLPFWPDLFAYSRTSNRLYLAASGDNSLLVFDPDGDTMIQTIAVGFDIQALQWDTIWNRVYIGGATDTAELQALDCAGDTLSPGIRTGLLEVFSLTLSTVSHKLYCAGTDTSDIGAVAVVGTDSLRLVGTLPELPSIDFIAYSPVTDRLYVFDNEEVSVCDCRTDSIRTTRDVGSYVNAMAASSLTGRVYLGIDDSAQVLVMDTTDSVIGTIRLPGTAKVGNDAMAFSPDRNQIYGATGRDGMAFAVDASSDTLAGWVSYLRTDLSQMIYNPAGNKLYGLCPGQSDVLVFDSTFGTPKRIPCSMSSPQPVLNQTLNRLYVATASRLRVIDCNSDSNIASKVMYGISHPVPVMVPYLNKLYVFSGSGSGDTVYAYDCLRDTVLSIFYLTDAVPCAVFDSRSNRVFFACEDAPTLRAIDPTTNSVVKTFDLVGGSNNGRMALNPDLGRLYYTDQSPNRMFTIDVLADSVLASDSLPWNVDTMFLDQRLGKLYLCSRDLAAVLVFDCAQGAIVDTVYADFRSAGLMDDRNDKLYLRYGAVVDCRYDSVVTRLDSISPLSMAWDAINNRVFQATTSKLYVYRDDLTGVDERKIEYIRPMLAVLGNPARSVVNLEFQIPHGQTGTLTVHDATGRLVHSSFGLRTSSFRLDFRSRPAGVYFVTLEADRTRTTDKVILQH